MDTQKRAIIWTSSLLVVGVTAIAIWQVATGTKPIPSTPGSLSVQVAENEWTRGSLSSPISLVEYSDFQCPACGAYHPVIEEILKEDTGNIAFTYRHFPLPQHKNALDAAYASEAAGLQGKFWEMHKLIFEHQNDWSESTNAKTIFEGYATEIGLDLEKFKTDRDSEAIKDAVAKDKESGSKSGVNSTPTFYLNGKKISNPQGLEAFKELIKSSLAEQRAVTETTNTPNE